MKHESASVSFANYRQMIQQAQSRLPESVSVVLLADSKFVHTKLMTMLTSQLGWQNAYPNQKQYLDKDTEIGVSLKAFISIVERQFACIMYKFIKESSRVQFM